MGVELVIQPIDWDSKELELETGRVDCLWNGLSITDEAWRLCTLQSRTLPTSRL